MRRKLLVLVLSGLLIISSSMAVMADQSPNFADIQGHWGEQVILDIASRGLMQGIGSNEAGQRLFAPDMLVDRAQTAFVLVSVFKLDYGSKRFFKQPLAGDYYKDVDNQSWFANAAMLCAINEIFPASDHFNPQQPISRLEMAQAIQRCFEAKGINIPMIMSMPVFSDVSALSATELNAVAFVNNTGIMKGDDQKFRPSDSITRTELAQILENCLQELQSQATIGESYNGQEYTTDAGQTFTLALPSNPTTGSEWTLSDNYDHSVIKLSDSYYKSPPQSDPPILGQGGTAYWVFNALQTGSTELKLTYGHPWEPTTPFQTFTVKITVSAGTAPAAALKFTTQAIKSETKNMVVDMQVPVVSGIDDQAVQSAINARWKKDADSFVQEVSAGLPDYLKESQEGNFPANPFNASSEYKIGSTGPGLLSMYVDYYQYTGGAHGGTARVAYNIDLKTGKNLALADLFKSGFDYKTLINQAIQKQIDANPENYFDASMGFKGISADQGFYIQDNNLVIYFQQYDIAPYAAGLPEFNIPLTQLQSGMVNL